MGERIGIFVCDCGTNISEVVDTGRLAGAAGTHRDVVRTAVHRLWCSAEGKEDMRRIIREESLSRVVVAACSPKQHEITFRKVLSSANLNPYLLQMANIREQIAWVTNDQQRATEKAIAHLHAAIHRVAAHQPLEKASLECKQDFLVIGAGIAGMSAALTLAQKNRKVYLAEREPWIGGKVVAYEDVYPNLECAPCLLEPKEDEILHHENIVLLTGTVVENLKGFFGNFNVRLRTAARQVDIGKCIGCGVCYDACPVKVKNKFQGNLSERRAIYSAYAGALPNAPAIDRGNCLRFRGETCTKCQEACPFGAIDFQQEDRTADIEVGAVVVATGFDLYDVSRLKNIAPGSPDVLDAFQFERLLAATGPTEGRLVNSRNAPPGSIAFIHCGGSRDRQHQEYCSGVCCAYSLKLAHLAKKKLPDAKIYELYSDWCLPGKGYQEFYRRVAEEGNTFVRVRAPNAVKVTPSGDGLSVDYGEGIITADMAVVAPAMVPASGSDALASILGLGRTKDGFYALFHDKLAPAATNLKGVYVAGCATGPKDITQSVLQAQAAGGMALSVLVPGEKLELEAATSFVNEARCGGCRVCGNLCPYQAIQFDAEKKASVINEVLCRGCGICVAACPAGAITNKHFTGEQLFSEIEGILHEEL